MQYTVKCIYKNGVHLTHTAVVNTVFYTGRIIIEEMPLRIPLGAYARKARLIDVDSLPSSYGLIGNLPASYDIIRPIFKAEILRSKNGHMMINGFQIHIDETTSEIQQHIQCWLLCPANNKKPTRPSIKTRLKLPKWILGRCYFILR